MAVFCCLGSVVALFAWAYQLSHTRYPLQLPLALLAYIVSRLPFLWKERDRVTRWWILVSFVLFLFALYTAPVIGETREYKLDNIVSSVDAHIDRFTPSFTMIVVLIGDLLFVAIHAFWRGVPSKQVESGRESA